MKSTSIVSSLLGTTAAMFIGLGANAGSIPGFTPDSQYDLFDNGFANLDLTGVQVSDDGTTLSIAVTTRGFDNWTKYLLFFDTASGGTTSNPWGRPIDIGSNEIDYFVGSWVDQPSDNMQFWSRSPTFEWTQSVNLTNSVSGNTVTFNMSLASLGLGAGSTFFFDVATSGGGGGDAGVDHLSNAGVAMSGWGATSYAGTFISYTTTPAPGVIALAGLAGLVKSRRRR